jgi:RNA polymerase sigma factor (sigma-70 family)
MRDKMIKKHPVQRMMEEARRGVAPREHDYRHEKSLIIAFQNGNEEAGFELIKLYQDVFSVIINKPADAPFNGGRMKKLWDGAPTYSDYEDMYQEIITQFLEMVMEFNTSGKAPFAHKVRKTLHQRFFNRYFSEFIEKRDFEKNYDDEINLLAYSEDEEEQEESKKRPDEHKELYDALDKLTKRQKEILLMSALKGWDSTIIASELGISNSSVRSHLQIAKRKVKENYLKGAV